MLVLCVVLVFKQGNFSHSCTALLLFAAASVRWECVWLEGDGGNASDGAEFGVGISHCTGNSTDPISIKFYSVIFLISFILILFNGSFQNVCPSGFGVLVFFRKSISLCQSTLGWREGKGWRGTGFPYLGCTGEMFPCGMKHLLGCVAVLNAT